MITIFQKNPVVEKERNVDELLIEAVRSKPGLYDFRVPASTRTMLRKNALWVEVSNILQGSLSPEEAKARWKYLRDNYIKTRKKVKAYIPSGSAAPCTVTEKKSKYQYYELMKFLDNSLQTRPTVSSLTDSSEVVTLFNIGNEQSEDDAVAGPSIMQISAINNSRQTSASIPSRSQTPINIFPQTFDSINALSETPTSTKDFSSTERGVLKRSKRLFIYICIRVPFIYRGNDILISLQNRHKIIPLTIMSYVV
ncbi:uncharacterized protein LOC105286854 [Ooceraea biroi]|nr:uncharacterized protein LOC105286854 [Ooceraea biroi]